MLDSKYLRLRSCARLSISTLIPNFQDDDARQWRSRPKLVYSKRQTTLLHPLEAPVGLIKYDAVGHYYSEEAGMFGSPISTVAYLMNCSGWDDRAEKYLKNTVSAVGGCG